MQGGGGGGGGATGGALSTSDHALHVDPTYSVGNSSSKLKQSSLLDFF